MEGGRSKRFTWFAPAVLLLVLLVVFFVTRPVVIRSQRDVGRSAAVDHARRLGLALFEFETEFGRFPDESTAAVIRKKTNTRWKLSGDSSNDYLRQLIAAGFVMDERTFETKTAWSKRPDRRIENDLKALGPGECGFGYLMNGNEGMNAQGNPARPVLCTPLSWDGRSVSRLTFDSGIHSGYGVLLRVDSSAQSVVIRPETGEAILSGGKTLLQTGSDTIWGDTDKPVIVPPLPKR